MYQALHCLLMQGIVTQALMLAQYSYTLSCLPSTPFQYFFKCKMFTRGSDSLSMMAELLSVQGFDWCVIPSTATVS